MREIILLVVLLVVTIGFVALVIPLVEGILDLVTYRYEHPNAAKREERHVGNENPQGVRLDVPHRLFAVCAALWALLSPWLVDSRDLARWLSWHDFEPANVHTWATVIVAVGVPLLAYVAIFILAPPTFRWIAAGADDRPKP